MKKHTNDLVKESSPYLQQHAHNPVDWMPWGDAAFEKAKAEDKLVLVSIGYSACHWCHVMEHETFEDREAAALMNDHFVCIKVDREEHPEVDQVYMSAVQLMTRMGGWPLNCFALPDGRPIYGGTYFPKEQWMEVLKSLAALKKDDPKKMEDYAGKLTEGVSQLGLISPASQKRAFDREFLQEFVNKWSQSWDRERGGPTRAPKFPMPNNLSFLLEYAHFEKDKTTMDFVETSLRAMCRGGIYDQIGGGFARYSTDAEWKVPHFEKMLYDNAQLVSLYSEAFKKTKSAEYERVVRETLRFVEREMTSDDGLFYSGLDADSEGEEGKFYVWTKGGLEKVLGDDYQFAAQYFGVNANGYWEGDKYILLRPQSDAALADQLNVSLKVVESKYETVKEKLIKARADRVRPGLDNKILTSWNALMISGYVSASNALDNRNYEQKALHAAELIWKERFIDGVLYRSFKSEKEGIKGSLEDYCFTIEAFLHLYESTFDEKWLDRSVQLLELTNRKFRDRQNGMFWFSHSESSLLFSRKQEITDNVIPASNSSVAHSFFLAGKIFDREDFTEQSLQMLQNILPEMNYPEGFSNWAKLYLRQCYPFYEVAVTGPKTEKFRREINGNYLPGKILLGARRSSELPLLKGKFLDETTIFVCRNKTCSQPVNSVPDAVDQLKP